MPSLYHMVTYVLVLVLAVASVLAIPVDRRENSLFRQTRSIQVCVLLYLSETHQGYTHLILEKGTKYYK